MFAKVVDRCWRPETGIFLCVWLLLMVGGRSKLFRDPGTFWHTRFGTQMLDTRQLVRDDPYSFSAPVRFADEHWIPHQWLGECFMALLYQVDGWDTLLAATVTILAALYTWLAHRLIRAGLHWILAGSLMALTIAASSSHFHVRPHLATLVGFGLTCAFMNDFEMGRKSLTRLFWLVPVYVLWTNLHGGLLGGLASMILVIAGWIVFKIVRLDSPLERWRQVVSLALLVLACGLTAFVNPYGTVLPRVWLKILNAPHLTEIILEHRPLDLRKPDGQTVLLLALVYGVMLAGVRPLRALRVTWLLPLVWLYLACTRIRHASLFSIAAVLAVADIFPHTLWAQALVRRGSDLFAPPTSDARRASLLSFALPAALVLSTLVLQGTRVPAPIVGHGWAQLDQALWPTTLTDDLRRYPPGTRLFNEMNLGGFLMFHAPNLRIFIDDRCELYGGDFLLEYAAADHDPARVAAWAREFSFDLALTQTGSPLDAYFRDPAHGWVLLKQAAAASLYSRHPAGGH